MTAISDTGDLFEFNLPTRAATSAMRIRPLPHAAGAAKRDRDTESLVVHGDRAWVGYERSERRQALPARGLERGKSGAAGVDAAMAAEQRARSAWCGCPTDASSFSRKEARATRSARLSCLPATRRRGTFAPRRCATGVFRASGSPTPPVLPDGRLLILNRQLEWWGGAAAILVLAELPEPRPAAEIVSSPDCNSARPADGGQYGGAQRHAREAADDRPSRLRRQFHADPAHLAAGIRACWSARRETRRSPPRPASSRSRASGAAP